MSVTEEMTPAYARHVGERLRNIRRQQGLSLQAVEEQSEREFKASVLGAYERGERIISVLRLQRLARLYGVPVDQLLPKMSPEPDFGSDSRAQPGPKGARSRSTCPASNAWTPLSARSCAGTSG